MKLSLLLAFALALVVSASRAEQGPPQVVLETSMGSIVVELDSDRAPDSAANFLEYVRSGFYDGTIFHRVISRFMIQGGGFTADMTKKSVRAPIANEADNGLRNQRGTIALARTSDPHSATSQFFINTVDNTPLDHVSKDPRGWGYAVFGRVIEGMDVVDAIEKARTGRRGAFADVPLETISIISARVRGESAE